MELAKDALPDVAFPEAVWDKDWVVYSKPTVQGTEKVLSYLARYVHRVAITNNRILSVDKGAVTFRYKDSRETIWKVMTLPAEEFIRRFLQHVLPQGFHKVRYYGILSPSNRHLLKKAKELLETTPAETDIPSKQQRTIPTPLEPMICPSCKTGRLFLIGTLPRKQRAPP
jgi:hypothetical protein